MEQDEPGLQGCNAFGRYRMNRFIQSGLLGADAIMLQAQRSRIRSKSRGWGVIGVRYKQTKGSDA
jgi:hypothetical protein